MAATIPLSLETPELFNQNGLISGELCWQVRLRFEGHGIKR
jgi:hypothetical protein